MRLFIGRDNLMRWYLVEAGHRQEWDTWVDSASDEDPQFAVRIDGSPELIEFEVPD